ncbi:MAG: helix-turn-helix domain-containing protein [Nitrososphaeria archaeon]|nr:helix-turn-helix domain-containing protein [Nitrososphaeria archaeon]MDW8021948.1 helix-turn-helix domain-containing protein [Nitrososphaerota archaeon]
MDRHKKSGKVFPGEDLELVEDFGEVVRAARIKMGLTQEDLARQLNEKLATIKKIESGEFKPPIVLARRLERFLKVRLLEPVEAPENVAGKVSTRKEPGISLGDLIKKESKTGLENRSA